MVFFLQGIIGIKGLVGEKGSKGMKGNMVCELKNSHKCECIYVHVCNCHLRVFLVMLVRKV